jgi:alpha-galactosidase
MSEDLGPAAATKVAAAETPAYLHLRSPGCSLLLVIPALDDAGTSPLLRIVHWGPALDNDVDAAAGSEAVFAYVQLASSPTEVPPSVQLRGLEPGRRYRVEPVPLAGGPSAQEIASPPWAADGIVLTGQVLMAVGLQMPVLHAEQAIIVHLTQA